MMLYVNTATGTIEEVEGDSFLVNLDALPEGDYDLNAEELVEIAQEHGVAEEIAR